MPGVFPIHFKGKATWVMLGEEANGKGWCYFSGDAEGRETHRAAAAREGAEEMCELYGGRRTLAGKIVPLWRSRSSESKSFLLFARTMRSNADFQRRRGMPKYRKSKYQEMSRVEWFKLADLISVVKGFKRETRGSEGTKLGTKDLRSFLPRILKNNEKNFWREIKPVKARLGK